MKIYQTVLLAVLMLTSASGPLLAGYYEQGRQFYVYKKYDKAREMFLKAVEKNPHGDAYYFLGEIEKLQGNFDDSAKYFNEATKIKNTTGKFLRNAYWNLIVLAEQKGDYDNVVITCKRMWDHLKDDGARQKIESLINKGLWTNNQDAIDLYKKGIEKKERGSIEEAISLFKDSLGQDSSFLAPKFEIAMAAYKKGRTGEAASYLREITSRIPYYAEAHIALGDIYYQDQSYSSAITHFSKALEFGFISNSTEYILSLKMAESYYNENDYDKSAEKADRAHSLNRKAVKPLILLSAIQIKQQKYDEALKTLQEADRLESDNSLVLFQIGSIYYKQNDWRYLTYFDRLFDTIKENKDECQKYNKTFIILIKGHFEKNNFARLNEIITALPESQVSYDITLLQAKSYFSMKKYDEAIDVFEKLSLKNDDKFMLGQAYARSGRKSQAMEILNSLMYYDNYRQLAEKDPQLSRLLKEIEKQKKTEEEEIRKKEEMRREKEKEINNTTPANGPVDTINSKPDTEVNP